ncbi:MAG TPA: hypothetical protein EYP04_03045 [Anaerolineae bacterium]|nr:hypothetical protein [Anaerolineae bacterium]
MAQADLGHAVTEALNHAITDGAQDSLNIESSRDLLANGVELNSPLGSRLGSGDTNSGYVQAFAQCGPPK